jgi:hypothetical protein
LRPLPRPEDELVPLDKIDPDPGVVLEAVVKLVDDSSQQVVGVAAPGCKLLDSVE